MERSYADLYQRNRQGANGAFKKAGTWLWGALGLGAVLVGYVAAIANEIAPAPQVAKDLVCQWREWRAKPAPGTQFTILISNLASDADGSQTARVRKVFRGQRGLDVRSTCRVVEVAIDDGSLVDAEAKTLTQGQALLTARNADLLIWGEVEDDRELSLWFLTSGGGSSLGAPSYSLTEKLTLPENFRADLGAQLQAVALAQVSPATEQAGTYLVDLLVPVRAKLQQLLTNPPADLSDEQQAELRFSLALAAQTIGTQSGENEPLEAAVSEYRAALEVRTRERVPLAWATTQNNLGAALSTLGEREDGTVRLEAAVAAYRAALEVRTRERVPLDWAMTQNNLGTALWTLGEREGGTQRLQEAIAAYRAALEVYSRERVPLQWAVTQNNLGAALAALGEREDGARRLEAAVAAYRAALEVGTRERVPLDWAMTQNNLGNALRALGEREDGTRRLEEAVAAFHTALEVWTRERVPLQWARAQNNLGTALNTLGAREDGTVRLEAAVAAHRAALEVWTRERVPLDWAMTQNNLGAALNTLGEREDGASDAGRGRLEEAVAAYEVALEVFRKARASHYVGVAEGNLARAEALLVERRGQSAAE